MNEVSEIRITANMKTQYMYTFLLQHTYRSFSGIFGIGISVAAAVLLVIQWNQLEDTNRVILFIVALLFTVCNPLMLYSRARRQVMMSESYKQPLLYIFHEDGILVELGEQQQDIAWSNIREVRSYKQELIIYTSKVHAFILGNAELGEQREEVERLIRNACKDGETKFSPMRKWEK